jgi:hypothetical protein
MRFARYLPLLAVLVFAAWFVGARVRRALLSDEERIRLVVEDLVDAAERRDVGDLVAAASEDYRDPFHPDREALRLTLMQLALRFRAVEVRLHELDIAFPPAPAPDAAPDDATVTLRATVLFGQQADEPPTLRFVTDRWGGETFVLRFRKEEGRWRVRRAEQPEEAAR